MSRECYLVCGAEGEGQRTGEEGEGDEGRDEGLRVWEQGREGVWKEVMDGLWGGLKGG